MDPITLFKQAAAELQKDERCVRLAAARKANDEDETLQEMIREFNLLRVEINAEIEKDPRDDEKVASLNTRINELYNDIMGNPSMMAYNLAKEDMKGLVGHVNAIIEAAIDGEDPMLVEAPHEGCSDEGCASCSGCG